MSMTSYRPGVVVALAAAAASLLLALVFAAQPAGAAFSSKNGEITFVRGTRAAQVTGEVYVMGRDGSGQTRLTNNAVFDGLSAFSPDGEAVVFTSNRGSTALRQNDDIYLADSDGSGTPTRLTDNPAVDEFPAFSPDGEELVFSSDRDGTFDIYTMEVAPEAATGNQPLRLTDSPEIDSKPDWGPSLYDFGGFYEPVDNLPTTNGVKAGSAVPVKFDLGGDQGLDVLAAENPASRRIDCDSAAPIDNIEQTTTAGESGLSYDTETGRYVYVWKTDKAWSGTCRQFVMRLDDGTVHRADFEFK